MWEFKLNYYFEKYKDTPFSNRQNFKRNFIKNHGEFKYLNELIINIEKYQIEKFGNKIVDYDEFKTIKSLPHQLAEILCNNYYDNELCVTNDLHVIIRENM